MTGTLVTKEEAREIVRSLKRQMKPEEIKERSKLVMKKLEELPCFLEARTVYCYVSYNQEVDTRNLINRSLELGKEVAVPRVEGKDIAFYTISSLSDLKPGYQGILEPSGSKVSKAERALMIFPGLAFDLKKNRVGYGGGFYDRYLASHRNISFEKTALAFDFQIMDALKAENYDEKVDRIVTDKRII